MSGERCGYNGCREAATYKLEWTSDQGMHVNPSKYVPDIRYACSKMSHLLKLSNHSSYRETPKSIEPIDAGFENTQDEIQYACTKVSQMLSFSDGSTYREATKIIEPTDVGFENPRDLADHIRIMLGNPHTRLHDYSKKYLKDFPNLDIEPILLEPQKKEIKTLQPFLSES